ncbi:MAG: amidohydrolase [Victivallales bacterium]|nr:amidohydrolase [Victivallales bacterium]
MNLLIRNANLNGKLVDISIEGNRFSTIAPNLEGSFDEEFDAKGMLAFPPFYNCHTHVPMVLLRGYADDLELFTWLNDHIWPAEENFTSDVTWGKVAIYAGTRLACLEMIKSGTVFFNDSYFIIDQTIRAVEEMGMRACIGTTWLNTGNADKCARLSATNDAVRMAYQNGEYSSRTLVAEAPHSIYTVPEKDLREIAERSAQNGMLIHLHLAETSKEVQDCKKEHYGLTPVEYIKECGLLNKRARLAHAVWLSPHDIELIKESGAVLIHNPTSNLKLCSGMFHFKEIDEAGIPFTLGTDGCASNNAHSMFSEMKFAALSGKTQAKNPTAAPAERVFRLATADGAQAFFPEGGEIAPGKLADLMLINPDQPYFVGDYNPISNLVYAGESSCVDSLLCDGKFLMKHRQVEGEAEIIEQARRVCDKFRR